MIARLRFILRQPITGGQLLGVAALGTVGFTVTVLLGYGIIQSDRAATKRGACISLGRGLYANTADLHFAQQARGCPVGGRVLTPNLPPVDLPPPDTDRSPAPTVTATSTTTATTTVSSMTTSTSRVPVPGPTRTVSRPRATVRVTSTKTCAVVALGTTVPPCR